MNKIEIDNNIINIINITNNQKLYLFNNKDNKKIYNIEKDVKVVIYQYDIDCNSNIEINLNGENANIEYHYSVINYKDNNFKIEVKHNFKNTTSNIFNHGVNVLNNKLHFSVSGEVKKNMKSCTCNQENQIINLNDGKSTILPILLIDNYDVSSSHSAYIGKFKEDIIFYLMSRGISRDKAIRLLISSLLINGGKDEEKLNKFRLEIENI